MRSARWQSAGRIGPANVAEPSAGPGEALIGVSFCGICGSDLHAFRTGVGILPGHIFGHELSGRVLSAPGVDGLAVGDRVAVRPVLPCGRCSRCQAGEENLCEEQIMLGFDVQGAMAEQVLVPRATAVDAVLRLPPEIGLRTAALIEPLAVGLRSVRLASPAPADAALVVGCGPIGLAAIHFLAAAGAQPLVASDPSALRRRMAMAMGATDVIDPTSPDSDRALRSMLASRAGFDLAIDCAGVEASIGTALRSVRRGGRVVMTALYGSRVLLSVDRVVNGEVVLMGSFAYRDELHRVIELIAAGRLDARAMITHEFDLETAQEAFDTQLRADESIKVVLRVDPDDAGIEEPAR